MMSDPSTCLPTTEGSVYLVFVRDTFTSLNMKLGFASGVSRLLALTLPTFPVRCLQLSRFRLPLSSSGILATSPVSPHEAIIPAPPP